MIQALETVRSHSRSHICILQRHHRLRHIAQQNTRVLQLPIQAKQPLVREATFCQMHVLHEGTLHQSLQSPLHVVQMVRVQILVLLAMCADMKQCSRARRRP